jgi:hypothetical protein
VTTLTGVALNGTMTAPSGSMTFGPYGYYWDCSWQLNNPMQRTFAFTFPVYSVESGYDTAYVGDGGGGSNYTTNAATIIVRFHSDGSSSYNGFTLVWNMTTAADSALGTWPARYTCADVTDLTAVECHALEQIVRSTPGVVASTYRRINVDGSSTYFSGTPWFSTTTACGSSPTISMSDGWTGIEHCRGSNDAPRSWAIVELDIAGLSSAGAFPDVSSLTSLTDLQIYNNPGLTGTIHASLGSLTSLTNLRLGGNPLVTGTLPSSLGSLTALSALHFSSVTGADTPIQGAVPASLCSLFAESGSGSSSVTCTLPATIWCPLPTCASLLNNCRTNQAAWRTGATPTMTCITPSPPPPSSMWIPVSAAITLLGYAVDTFGSTQRTAFVAVLSAQLYVPTSSVQITGVTASSSAVSGHRRRLHQAVGSVTVAFTVTATSAATASLAASTITGMATSPAFLAALQSGGLPAASATALAVPPTTTSGQLSSPPPSGGGSYGGGGYYTPTYYGGGRASDSPSYSSSPPSSSSSGVAIGVGIAVPLVSLLLCCCRMAQKKNQQQQGTSTS